MKNSVKILSIVLARVIVIGRFAACGDKNNSGTNDGKNIDGTTTQFLQK